jgi:hypothetical protein
MQLATYAGWRVAGVAGGLIGGLLFVIPGAVVILALAALYSAYGGVPLAEALFLGIKATVIVIVAQALLRVSKKALKGPLAWGLATAAFLALFVLQLPFPLVVIGAGLIGYAAAATTSDAPLTPAPHVPLAQTGKHRGDLGGDLAPAAGRALGRRARRAPGRGRPLLRQARRRDLRRGLRGAGLDGAGGRAGFRLAHHRADDGRAGAGGDDAGPPDPRDGIRGFPRRRAGGRGLGWASRPRSSRSGSPSRPVFCGSSPAPLTSTGSPHARACRARSTRSPRPSWASSPTCRCGSRSTSSSARSRAIGTPGGPGLWLPTAASVDIGAVILTALAAALVFWRRLDLLLVLPLMALAGSGVEPCHRRV